MKPQFKWSHAIFLFAAVPLVFELTYIGSMFGLLSNVDYAKKLRTNSMNASYAVSRFMVRLLDSGATVVGTEVGMMNGGDRGMNAATVMTYNRNYWQGREAIENSLKELVNFLSSQPQYRKFAVELDKQYFGLDSSLKAGTRMFRDGDVFGALKLRLKLISYMENMIAMSREFVAQQQNSTAALEREESRMKSILQTVIAAFLISSFFGAGLLAVLINRTIVQKLQILSGNVSKLAAHESIGQLMKGDDEFASLDLAFRNMFQAINEARNKEKIVVDSALDMICTLTEKGIFTRVNPASERLLGLRPERLIGIDIQQLVPEQERQLALHNFRSAVDKHGSVSFEMALVDNQAGQIDTLWSVSWSQAEQSFFCVVHDITERKQAELVRQEITAMISHDLRTPITSIQVALDLMNARAFGELPPEFKDEVAAAGMKSLEAMDLINDLLDIEKFEKSDIAMHVKRHSLTDLVATAWGDIRPGADLKGIEIDVNIGSVNISVDRDQFVRVLRNLLRNSVTNAPEGSTIFVGSRQTDGISVLAIEDGGPLVAESERDSIFDRFQDIESKTSLRTGGVGLSLAVCKALVSAHGGTLRVGVSLSNRFEFLVEIPPPLSQAPLLPQDRDLNEPDF